MICGSLDVGEERGQLASEDRVTWTRSLLGHRDHRALGAGLGFLHQATTGGGSHYVHFKVRKLGTRKPSDLREAMPLAPTGVWAHVGLTKQVLRLQEDSKGLAPKPHLLRATCPPSTSTAPGSDGHLLDQITCVRTLCAKPWTWRSK